MKKILHKILRFFAKKVLNKYQPIIIGITGSVGKSATKEAVYYVLKNFRRVRRSLKNYNNEIGVPLTILGRMSPGKNLAGWLRVFWLAFGSIWYKERSYPEILILEMAADHPGDIKYLTNFAPCQIGVLTAIGPSHLEYFKNIDNVIKEKQEIVTNLKRSGWAVLNIDDPNIAKIKEKVDNKLITYGTSAEANVQAVEINLDYEISETGKIKINGLRFKVKYHGSIVPVFLPQTISLANVYTALAAIAVGMTFDFNLVEASDSLKQFASLPGRMKPIDGKSETLVIDDTYNSSPNAVLSALKSIKQIKLKECGRKWIVLADMLELGKDSTEQHRLVGEAVAKDKLDHLITFGEGAKNIALGAREAGMPEQKIKSFDDKRELIKFLNESIQPGDLILVKGSQGMRMEQVVKELMLQGQAAKHLLVRQGDEWGRIN
ncbi:MAG: UDP-N-acetylmuramoyl-tripeptide--D-alanyl-D-alanine ligase [Patescibacteria group bacterium]|nr:UDP-N-acetylmuramoyl-tripeptide--D-alanyl-D-alanine ligase [Patescibacteria group bacterium]MDD5121460.1 UDP-N-acetylmuramoyl-tripeptide--D-alanyl-D-alanine ligase [Patescibacteria group bacterium]MDD5222028.1 UDP-N-acetylmuramoyl-tripeptide--D-alanyl-D-alanine ligase [Patescibacteria group bacterium]MDD5396378.1 UDP-N-acetylmuramoyl-tripeptide--D-alanyl-D-alanine ligase [Patescibacteria group bacterium]